MSCRIKLQSFVDELRSKVAAADANSDDTRDRLVCVPAKSTTSDLLGECLDSLLDGYDILIDLCLSRLSSQFDVPDLTAFGRVDHFSGKHRADASSDTLIIRDFPEKPKAFCIDFSMGVIEPDLVEDLEPQALIASLVL